MATAKIVKSKNAPEGELNTAFGMKSFKVSDTEGYETDDPQLIEEAVAHPFFDVEYGDDGVRALAKAEHKEIKELHKAQDRAEKQRAEKDPLEPAAPKPYSVDELHELKKENNS